MQRFMFSLLVVASLCVMSAMARADAVAGESGSSNLVLATRGKASVVVAVDAAPLGEKEHMRANLERAAADDLAKYIGMMTGSTVTVVHEPAAVKAALDGAAPVILVGKLAESVDKSVTADLKKVAKKNPTIAADAVVVRRKGNRVFVAGTNEISTYSAASWLLREWGCRWYIPGELGEVVPDENSVAVGDMNFVYAPPFEVRGYWISWNGNGTGRWEFTYRNFMNGRSYAGMGHALAKFTGDLVEEGKSSFNVPFSDPNTAEKIVEKMATSMEARPDYGISLAIEDGNYTNDSKEDAALQAGFQDKYFLKPMMTDPMMALYSKVGELLKKEYPGNPTRFGGMAYVNVSIPPQWKHDVPDNLVIWNAPIDIDPNHGYNDPDSPPRQEYGEMVRRWAEIMDGRTLIYDYDQGMLVWRDMPNPSQQAFKEDAKLYRDAGILGISTESRNAIATTWLNLFFRGQLMWNPDVDVDALTQEFYPNFYGPAAEPMGKFWDAIFTAWDETIVTEHEYMAAPAIYTPALMKELAGYLAAANKAITPLQGKSNHSRNESLYVKRMELANMQWAIMDNYMNMVFAAATDADYAKAAAFGVKGLAAITAITKAHPVMTTGFPAKEIKPGGSAAWWPGEVAQYQRLAQLTDGEKGKLIKKLPVEWAFHRDPNDTGLPRGWAYKKADLSHWNSVKDEYDIQSLKDYPTTEWEMIRTDVYSHALGIRHPDRQSFTGFLWYKTDVDVTAAQAKGAHIKFPGLFSETWLYVNGDLVAHRVVNPIWWYNDYAFEWDVDIAEHLKAGTNDITIRVNNPHHFGGMFRRPFLYRPVE